MGSLTNNQNHQPMTTNEEDQVIVIMVPFPAQGHLNQLLQLSCLVSSHNIPVHYIGSAIHNRQAKTRANALNPNDVGKIHFHDFPIPPFASPPPNPKSSHKFPTQLQPAWNAAWTLQRPIADYTLEMSAGAKRVVVIHDPLMATVVQDVASIPKCELYAFNCISAFSWASLGCEKMGKTFPLERELPPIIECLSEDLAFYLEIQNAALVHRAGDLYNTCRFIEAPYLDILSEKEVVGDRKVWAIGPILPTKLAAHKRHICLEWLDKQEPNSVIYVSFGSTTTLSDEEIQELAMGLEQSKQKFIWVLRDADKGNVFDGGVRRVELPGGFEKRLEGVGMVVRDWAPQPEILAHSSTGGFLSHCGWNSCMESMTMGVPIAAWPMHSDQPRNTLLITEILKIGLVVREWTNDGVLVKALTIEDVVKRLMASEEGDEIRRRAEELANRVRRATEEGGVSKVEFDSFLAHITR